jgi:hypothetical protein
MLSAKGADVITDEMVASLFKTLSAVDAIDVASITLCKLLVRYYECGRLSIKPEKYIMKSAVAMSRDILRYRRARRGNLDAVYTSTLQ